MAFGPITSWETVETVTDFIFLGFKITMDGDCSHEIQRHLLLDRKAMTNLQSTLKSKNRDSTLPTKIHLVNAMIFSSGHGWMWEVDHKEGWKKVKAVQWYPTLCNPMDYTVHGILLARMLQWVAIPFSRESSQPRSPTLQVDSLPAEPPGKHKRRLSTEELMLLNCGAGEDSWGSLG